MQRSRLVTAVESLRRDVHATLRLFRRHPGFAAAAVLTIALGSVPLAGTFALANALFFRAAPGVTADRLVRVGVITRDATGDTDPAALSYANHAQLTARLSTMTGLAGYLDTSASIVAPGVDALYVDVSFVMHEYFRVLGLRMAAGRHFTAEEDRPADVVPVVILGHTLASRLFDDAAAAVNRTVFVNGLAFTVVGVAADGFRGLNNDHYAQMWLPGAAWLYANHTPRGRWAESMRRGVFEKFIGRLAPDADEASARAELAAATRALPPGEPRALPIAEVEVTRQAGMSFSTPRMGSDVARMAALLTGAAGLLLLLAGANVGNLMLFRRARRRQEMATRTALGASRWQLLRAHLIEVSLLAVAGAALGLLLTLLLSRGLENVVIPQAGFAALPLDWRVIALSVISALVVGLAFGGVPALVRGPGSRFELGAAMPARTPRLRQALSVTQLALSLSLLVGSVLLLATVRNLLADDLGFDPSPIASAHVSPDDNGYDDARAEAYYRELLTRARARPDIAAVSVSSSAPVLGTALRTRVQAPGDAAPILSVPTNGVSADYFRVLGLPIVRGRPFSDDETFAAQDGLCGPIVLSESLATRLFGSADALNRVVMLPQGSRAPLQCAVVGVAADVRMLGAGTDWTPMLYRPFGRIGLFRATILARAGGAAPIVSASLRDVSSSIDAALPLFGRASLADGLAFQTGGRRIISSVLATLAALGLLMAAVGLYGLISETVLDRRRELGIRMAVGAGPRSILWVVLRRALILAVSGIAIGLALSAGGAQVLRAQLFGVSTTEPWIYATAAGVLALVVVAASLAPAIRATRVDVSEVLRAN